MNDLTGKRKHRFKHRTSKHVLTTAVAHIPGTENIGPNFDIFQNSSTYVLHYSKMCMCWKFQKNSTKREPGNVKTVKVIISPIMWNVYDMSHSLQNLSEILSK